ncbi:Isoquinoline 1-oxidoreductase subunit [Sinorhizobium sp. BG8]|uniref:Isoquinoline 1-oxidoreductase subunit n=1 Tax=Sinorhizobium sp. BG8 TaxID=2613773 RepID=UPI00193D193E|nr:Isoquinoline 1-oxidoreductase subunit [Sinorhizobium sp. BG8]QRM55577.1 Isoquinoline 1-oxidoreductase subunit [Sinorhizobium sp. BG8]
MTRRIGVLPLVTVLAVSGTLAGIGPLMGHAQTSGGGQLKAVSDFDAISNATERSKAIFAEASRVMTHPRCINCHPATRSPTQGEEMHPHVPLIIAEESSLGPAGLVCSTCHGDENRPIVGSRIKSIPGNAHWSLAPASMAWQGLTVGQICEQVKDTERNGNRSHADLIKHMGEDHLVGWAWHPGEGRSIPPGSQETFAALIAAWVATGAECPN